MIRAGIVTVTLNPALDMTLDCPGFEAGKVNRVRGQALHAGGKGINVAALLSGWCAPVTAAGFLGQDNASAFNQLFRARGIEDQCRRLMGATRTNIKIVDADNGRVTDINLPGLEVPAEAMVALADDLEDMTAENGCFVLSGSIPAGLPDTVYGNLARRLKARDCFVAVDTSGPPLRAAIAAGPDMIKPNEHELADLLGRPVTGLRTVAAAARELVAGGIGLVVVSMGADGAVFAAPGRLLHAIPPAVEVVSTVGAGDAMVAGVLAARLGGCDDLEDWARLGTAFAAGKLTQLGPRLPDRRVTEELRRAVRIDALEL